MVDIAYTKPFIDSKCINQNFSFLVTTTTSFMILSSFLCIIISISTKKATNFVKPSILIVIKVLTKIKIIYLEKKIKLI